MKPESNQRLSDHISLGVLTRVFPPEVVDEILDQCGRLERRHRLLPARVVVYYVLGLALFSSQPIGGATLIGEAIAGPARIELI